MKKSLVDLTTLFVEIEHSFVEFGARNFARRRLVPYYDWDKRTMLQLEELHLDNTNLHESNFLVRVRNKK